MDRDISLDTTGISRREMLIGAGVLAAGYGVGQLVTARPAFAQAPLEPDAFHSVFPWPSATWGDFGSAEAAAREAALRNYERIRAGGG